MSSPITLTGFNNVDFGLIIDAILEQERAPIRALEDARAAQQSRLDAFQQLAGELAAFESTLSPLTQASSFAAFKATPSDTTVLSAAAGTTAAEGTHTIVVSSLARAQVTASTSLTASTDTVVADGGSITIGGTTYTVTGPTTLAQLRDLVNADTSSAARASLVDTGSGFKLVLTARETGVASAFTVTNNLSLAGGAPGVAFADTDGDGTSGDSDADNAVVAADASLTIDNVAVTRSSNVVDGALPGVTLTLLAEGTTTVTVERDTATIRSTIESFVDGYNKLVDFLQQQTLSDPEAGALGPLAGDGLVRSVSSQIRAVLRDSVDTTGTFRNLAEIGILFDRTGHLTIDDARLDKVLAESVEDVRKLFQTTAEATDARVTALAPSKLPGTFAVTVSAVPTAATVTGSTAISNGGINADETLSFTYGTLTADIFLPKKSDIADIVALVNAGLVAAGIPITASDDGTGVLVLRTDAVGSAESFTVVSDVEDKGNGKSTGIGLTPLTATGTDIAGTIDGVAATGVGDILTAAVGSAAEGLSLRVATTATGDHGTVTVTGGLAARLDAVLDGLIGASGVLDATERRIEDAIDSIDDRILAMEERLAIREQELRLQFIAADQALSALNAQQGALGSFSTSLFGA